MISPLSNLISLEEMVCCLHDKSEGHPKKKTKEEDFCLAFPKAVSYIALKILESRDAQTAAFVTGKTSTRLLVGENLFLSVIKGADSLYG